MYWMTHRLIDRLTHIMLIFFSVMILFCFGDLLKQVYISCCSKTFFSPIKYIAALPLLSEKLNFYSCLFEVLFLKAGGWLIRNPNCSVLVEDLPKSVLPTLIWLMTFSYSDPLSDFTSKKQPVRNVVTLRTNLSYFIRKRQDLVVCCMWVVRSREWEETDWIELTSLCSL